MPKALFAFASPLARAGAACKRWLIDILSALLGLNAVAMIVVATIQIVSRLLGHPIAWTVELLLFLGLYSILPGAAVIFLKSEEIEVSFIVDLLPRFLRVWMECFTAILGMCYGALLFAANLRYGDLVGLGRPEQFLPLPPEANILPIYLLAAAIVWDMGRKLLEAFRNARRAGSGGEKPHLTETELP